MPIYKIQAPDGNIYRIEGPPNASDEDLFRTVAEQSPMAAKTTQELQGEKSAPTSLGDIAKSFGSGVVGAGKSLVDIFGAGSGASNYLGGVNEEIQRGLTPERQAEMARRAELSKRAEKEGTLAQIKSGIAGVLEAPLQSVAQGVGSSLPTIAAGLVSLPASAPTALALGVQRASQLLIAAAQGTGEIKGDIHDSIKQAYREKNPSMPMEEVERLATEAQAYTLKNAPLLIGGAAFGALDAVTGFERSTSQALKNALNPEKKAFTKEGLQAAISNLPEKAMQAPTYLGQAVKTGFQEGVPEGFQGGYGQLAQNIGLTQEGFETPTFKGVAGAAARDALVGTLTGTAMSPLSRSVANADFQADRYLRGVKAQQEFEAKREEFAKQQEQTRENLGVNRPLALGYEPPADEEKYTNPAATITKKELMPEEVKFVDSYRQQNNLPKLKAYSIEDIKDAMPGVDPEGEQGRIDSILAAKYGYKPVDDNTGKPVNYTVDDVVSAAEDEKNIATGTKGFADFLNRTTGSSDLNTMTQPQLFAAYSAIKQMPESEKKQILPEGTGASRFTDKQYKTAVSWFGQTFESAGNKPLSRETIIGDIQEATGLGQKQDAEALLSTAVKNGDLAETEEQVFRTYDANDKLVSTYRDKEKADAAAKKQGLNVKEETLRQMMPPPAAEPAKRTTLPAGYEMTKQTVKEGEMPVGFEIFPEGRGKALVTVPTEADLQAKIESLTGSRQKEGVKTLANMDRDVATLKKARESLESMEARGEVGSQAYELAKTRLAKQERVLGKRIERHMDRITAYNEPLKSRPTEAKKQVTREKVTVTKQGKSLGSFPDNVKAQEAILVQMTDEELAATASDDRLGAIADRAAKEIERRKQPAGIAVKRSPKKEEVLPPLSPELQAAADEISKKLVPILQRMGLGNVGLKIVEAIKNGAEGSYTKNLIKLAMDAGNPLEVMHHEALHALKDLGFFTDQQWATLEKQADKTWIDKYLKNVQVEVDGKTMSRYDAYVYLNKTAPEEYNKANPNKPQQTVMSDADLQALLREEAIADAFADFAISKPPGGMIASIMKRLNEFFKALKNAIMRSGFESSEDIFGKAQRGELRGTAVGTETEKASLPKPKSDIGHKREASTGRYVGAPDWIGNSPSQLANLRKKLLGLAKEGEVGRYWYENSSKAILNMVGGDKKEAEKIVSLIAIYSPNATVPANTSMALRAYYQYLTGQPISAGLGEGNKKAEELLVQNKPWSGIKTNSFYQNLMVEIDPSKLDPGVATMDMWMALAFDYGMKALDQGPKYKFAEREIQNIAAKLGWDAHQVQAAIWTAMKGRIEPIRNALKTKELEVGIGRMVEKDGKQVYQIYPEKRYDHFRLAHKMGMEYTLKKEDLEASKYDFSNALNERTAQMSYEATPGKTSGVLPGLLTAPTNQKMQYLEAVSKVLTDKDGQDVIANKIGLPSGKTILGFSAWQGDTGAGAQTFTAVALEGQKEKRDVTPESRQLLNLYCAIKGYVLAQEAVVWQVPVFDGSTKNQNGIQLKFNRGLNEEEMSKLYADIHSKFGTWELAPGYLEDGVRILNFTDISNKNYHEGMQELVHDLPDNFGGGMVDFVSYRSVGDYISNDWTQAPTGEQYAEQIAKAATEIGGRGRSDLPEWAADLRTRIEAVNERYSKEYGWGNPAVPKTGTEEKLSLRSARGMFEDGLIQEVPNYKGREKVIELPIKDFLKLAKEGEIRGKQSDIEDLFKNGTKLNSLPLLMAYNNQKGDLKVEGHEGRHRARALLAEGYDTMPVRFLTSIRWSEQEDPSKFDYEKNWPSKVLSEDSDDISIPMPVSREQSMEPYSGEKLSLAKLNPDSKKADVVSALPDIPMFRGVRGANTSKPVGAQYFTSSEVFAKTYSSNGKVDEHRVALENPLVVSDSEWSEYANSPFNPIEDIEAKVRDGGHDGVVNIRKTPMGSMVTVLALDSETATKPAEKLSLRSTRQPPESKEFKDWFTGSYFTSGGEPLIMYHGTARDITIFRGKQAKAIFITINPDVAETYSNMGVDYMRTEAYKALTRDEKVELITVVAEQAEADGKISKAELKEIQSNLKKRVPAVEKNSIIGLPYQVEGEIIESLNNLLPTKGNIMPVYVNAKNVFDYANKDHVNQVMDRLTNYSTTLGKKDNPDQYLAAVKGMISRGNWPRIESAEVQEAIQGAGFDGFSVLEAGTKNYAVYNPTAIKSVTGNIGTFGLGEISTEQAAQFGMTPEQARQAQAEGDIRFSLKRVPIGIPDNVWNLHNRYQEAQGNVAEREMVPQRKTAATKAFKQLSNAAEKYAGNENDALKLMQEMNTISGIRQAMAEDDEKALGTYKVMSPALWRQETGEKLSLRASTPAAVNDAIDRTTYVREEKGFVERMMEAISPKSWSDFRAKAMNRYDAMSVADKIRAKKMGGAALLADQSAEAAALMSDLAAGVTASALGVHDRNGGAPVFRNGITTIDGSIKGPVAIFAPLARLGDPRIYQMWQFYAGAKRARRYFKDGKEQNYTPADMAYADQLGQQYPEFKQIFDEWNKFNDALVQYQVDTGVLSKERADEYRKYSDYIPFYRQLEDENTLGPKVFQSISGVKQGKKLKGSEAPIADLMETIVRNVQSGIQAGMKNTAAQRAIKVFEDIGEAVPTHPTDTGPSTVYALVNGEKKAYTVADHALYNSMQSLNLPDLPFIGFFAGPANLLRNLVTKDPGFMLANMVRDSMSAWVTSGVKMTPIASAVKNFTGALRGTSPEYQALLNAGVLGGYEFSQNVEASGQQLKKELAKYGPSTSLGKITKPFTSLWEALEKGTTASDAATRMEVYKNVLAETGNEAEATFRALEVMNFNRKGSTAVVRILTAAVPFLNARIQGLDVLYRAAFGQMATQDAKAIQKSFFIRGATIMALSMIYWGLTHDDDDYKKQEQETRDNYWLIPSLGIKLPIPFEVGVIFKVIPERIAEYAFGTDTGKDFAKAMQRNFMSTFAFNPIPQTILPFVEAKTNYSFFTGRSIIGQGLEGVAPEFQVGPSTSRLAKWFGSVTGQSPMMIDHIIGGYTGTFGMYAVDAIDAIVSANSDVPKASKRFEQMPVLRRFLLDPEARGNVTAYYDLKNATDEAVRTSNFLERTMNFEDLGQYSQDTIKMLATEDFVKSLNKDLKEFNDLASIVRSSTMSGDEKREALSAINQAQNNLTSNIKLIRKSVD